LGISRTKSVADKVALQSSLFTQQICPEYKLVCYFAVNFSVIL
jgi:hypothetical protein